jgi:hypothetical protein
MQEKGKNIDSVLDGKLRIEWGKNRIIFVNSNNVPRLLIGPRLDGELAAELSQEDVDVFTATDDELIWSSRFNSFKIAEKVPMSLGFSLPDSGPHQYSVTEPHTQGYAPAYLAFADVTQAAGSFRSLVPSTEYSPSAYSTLIPSIVKEIWVDASEVKIQVSTNGILGTFDYDFTVYLLKETAA